MACKAKDGCKASKRGEPSVEWYKDGKPNIMRNMGGDGDA